MLIYAEDPKYCISIPVKSRQAVRHEVSVSGHVDGAASVCVCPEMRLARRQTVGEE